MAKKTKQEAQQERLSLAEKRNRQERRNKKSRKEREQEKRRKKQERDRRKQKNIPTTAQQSIPYIRMLQDGICQVTKTFFSKTIQFYDINYQLALNEDKTTIFENYCDFLNYFDSSISVQLSFINQQVDVAEFEKSIDIPDQNDDFNAIREEYRTMLKNQLSKGNNGLVKTKYITFGIEAESLKVARPRLERIETDILNNFKVLGAQAHSLNGLERLEILYHVFNQDRIEPFKFQYKMLPETGLKTKDFIAPTSFNFSKNQTFLMGRTMGSVSYLQILAPELTDRMLADFLDVDDSINVNIHIQSIDQSSAIKMIKSKISDLDKMKKGNHFMIYVLDDILCYEVDRISIVKPEDTSDLNVEKGSQVIYISRVRYADGMPMAIERNYFPLKYAFLLEERFDDNSLFTFLKEHSHTAVAISEKWIELCKATAAEAELLQMAKGTSMLFIKSVAYTAEKEPIYVGHQVFNGEKCSFYVCESTIEIE